MNKYDCIVYGNNTYALIVAVYLSRKMRKVLVIQDSSKIVDDFEVVNITDPSNNKYHFEYNSKGIISGLNKQGLTYEYFDDLGLLDEIKTFKLHEDGTVSRDNLIRKRIHNFEQFKVYLVRHYPKSRNQIHKFFVELERHYNNYTEQSINMLKNTSYTLTSLMIEWGDFTLKALLEKYFDDENLRREFVLNPYINGLKQENINSYSFFSSYVTGLKEGFYYLENSEQNLRDILIQKLKLINPKSVINTRIKDITLDENGKIKSMIDKDNNEYFSKYFFADKNPFKFYPKYFNNMEEDLNVIKSFYPNFDKKQYVKTMYLALNQNPKKVDIDKQEYYFDTNEDSSLKLIKLFNYSMYRSNNKNEGLLCVDFVYDQSRNYNQDEILRRLYATFPKLKKNIVGIKEGKAKQYIPMLSNEDKRKYLSINKLIDIEEFDHIQVFDNLYLGYKYLRPEAGLFGIFNQAIIFGDKIEDRLYFGEDDREHYLNNEEIMMIIRHNFNYKVFENREVHVNFHIGKNTYFVRTKGKNIVIHQGKYSSADLSIYTTNNLLSSLLLKKITFNEALESGSLKFRGGTDLLFQTVEAFNLDDFQKYNPLDFKKSKYTNLGSKFLFIYFGLYFVTCLLSNYVDGIFIYPVALFLGLLTLFFKYRSYEEFHWFDIFLNLIFFTGLILSIFWQGYNNMRFDDHLLGIISLALFISVFADKPVVYHYTKFDKNIDYRNSILFKIISNGLTFVWGFLFLSILVGTYITGERYVSVLYNLYFVGIFLMYFYPVIYVNTNIKK